MTGCHAARAFLLVAVIVSASGCRSKSPLVPSVIPSIPTIAIMGPAQLTPAQLVAWFNGRQPRPLGVYRATEPVEALAQDFAEEGEAEGVTGDVAFIQSVVETGWFGFEGLVPFWANNFAGIGATEVNPNPAAFPGARAGVRAQIQHLRAYADPGAYACSAPPLANPCVDPRFDLVVPKGKARTWNELGRGNWATSPTYAATILQLFDEARAFNGVR